ncbi:hypothetical protein D3C84_986270 [compost metagenome]
MDFSTHGLEAVFELADDAALMAEYQIGRAILQQASQAEAATAWRADLCRYQ